MKDKICFTAAKYFEDDVEHLKFSSSAWDFTESIALEWHKFKENTLIQNLPPELLIQNKKVAKLVEALELSMKQHKSLCESGDCGSWELEDDTGYVVCKEALKEWSAKDE